MSIVDRIGSSAALLRRTLAPRPWIRWVVLVASAVLFLAAVADHRRRLDETQAGWGDARTVWVTDHPVAAGETIEASSVHHPVSMLPRDPVADDPSGIVARQAIGGGEVVVGVDVAPGGAPADLIPAGWLAVPVAEAVPSYANVGERVVVTADGVIVAGEGVVVDDLDGAPLVAVPATVAPLVALANESGITLLRTP